MSNCCYLQSYYSLLSRLRSTVPDNRVLPTSPSKPPMVDGAEPSPNSTAAMNLLRFAQFTDRTECRARAQKTLSASAARLQSDPDAVPAMASALDFRLALTKQILIVGDPTSQDTRELLRQANTRFLPVPDSSNSPTGYRLLPKPIV